MANTYLKVNFKDKDAAKALGARWDGVKRQWYVPEGREIAPFLQWLHPNGGVPAQTSVRQVVPLTKGSSAAASPTAEAM
jgi:exodeoxyribonuclease VII large subunit